MFRKIFRTGRVAEPLPNPAEVTRHEEAAFLDLSHEAETGLRRGSVQLRHVDAGSCNGCELEITSCLSPVYDAERIGVRLVASPRHADGLLVTGPVTHNMAVPLRKTYEATPSPKIVVAVGDCALGCGVLQDGYGVAGSVGDVLPVHAEVPGCPPTPDAILGVLRSLME